MSTMTKVGKSSNRGAKPGERRGGRTKGTPNKLTHSVKQMIEHVAAGLGGAEGMLRWAQAAPTHERLFWSQIFPKLLPKEIKAEHCGEIGTASPVLVVPAPMTPDAWAQAITAYQTALDTSSTSDAEE